MAAATKYFLAFSFLLSFTKIKAQNDSILPWEIQFVVGSSIPIDIKNENAANLNGGTITDLSINYHFSDQYFVSLKFNYSKHKYSDQYSLNAYPVIRSHYFAPMIGQRQKSGKFYFEEKIGFGMLYARTPAYLSQKIGEFYFGKSSDASRTFIAEFNFLAAYHFTERFSLMVDVALKYSEIKWDIRYNSFVETDLGLEYILTDSYEQKVIYFPVGMSLGVAYHLYKKPPVGSFFYNLLDFNF